jgi:hypothetical protein
LFSSPLFTHHSLDAEFFTFSDLQPLNADGYFKCLNLLRPLFENATMFLRPTPTRLLITVALLLLAYGGYVQSEGFTDKDAGQPSLPLARLVEPIPHIWELWVLLLAPLALSLRLVQVEQLFNTGPTWFFWTLQALYFYLISCVIVLVSKKLARRSVAPY